MKTTALLLCLSVLLLVPWLGSRDFYSRGEPREALVMQDMLDSGNWLLPSGYGGVVPSKPPLMHWIGAAMSLPAGGVSEFTSRLPSAIACIAFLIFFFLFLRRRCSCDLAVLSTLILLTSVEWFRSALSARVDMLLSALLGSGLLALYSWYEDDFKGVPLGAVALFAAATLTKGPVSVVLPALIFGLFLLIRGEKVWPAVKACLIVFGPALAIALLWYISAAAERPDAFFGKFYYENVQRFMGTQEDEPHKHSALFLLATVLLGFLPWTLFVFAGAGKAWRAVRSASREKSRLWFQSLSPLALYFFLSTICFLVFFSVPAGKRSVYLLPVYPFISVWLASFLLSNADACRKVFSRLISSFALFVLLVWVAIGVVLCNYGFVKAHAEQRQQFSQMLYYLDYGVLWFSSLSLSRIFILALPVVAVILYFLRGRDLERRKARLYAFAAILSLVLFAAHAVFFPFFAAAVSPKDFADEVERLTVDEKDPFYSYGSEFYGLSFYMKRRFVRFEDAKPDAGLLFVNERDLDRFKAKFSSMRVVEIVAKSEKGITKPLQPVVALRFERGAAQ